MDTANQIIYCESNGHVTDDDNVTIGIVAGDQLTTVIKTLTKIG